MNWILVNKLKSSNVETCLQAGAKIASQPTDVVMKDIRKMLESRSKETRLGAIWVAFALPSIHGRKIISSILHDPEPMLRIQGLRIVQSQGQKEYVSEVSSCLQDSDDEVVIQAIESIIGLLNDAAASYLASLLCHQSGQIRKKTFLEVQENWKYEHLEKLRECLKLADITYAEEVDRVIQSIESRTALLSRAIESGGGGTTGVVEQPRFKAASHRGYPQQQPVIIHQVAPSPFADMMDDNTDIETRDGFTGVIKEVTIQDLLQLACINRKSQAFKIKTRDGTGEIYVKEGEIIHASFKDQVGQDALFAILSFNKGQFKEIKFIEHIQQTIHAPWEFLLMEAARVLDESNGAPEDIDIF